LVHNSSRHHILFLVIPNTSASLNAGSVRVIPFDTVYQTYYQKHITLTTKKVIEIKQLILGKAATFDTPG